MARKPRIISACNVCRRRRVRCDKTRPVCIVCVRHKCEDECSYKKLPAWADDKNTKEVDKNDLNASIANMENIDVLTVEAKISLINQIQQRIDMLESALQPKDETIDFRPLFIRVEPEFESITNVTPLSYLGTTFKDGVFLKAREFLRLSESSVSDYQYELLNIRHISGLRGTNNNINNIGNVNNINHVNNISNNMDSNNINDNNHSSVSNLAEKKFRIQIFDIISMVKHNGLKKMDKISFEKSLSHIPLPTGFNNFKGENIPNIIGRVNMRLPSLETISLLLDRFFNFVHPFFPYVDQKTFYDDMNRIIGPLKTNFNDVGHNYRSQTTIKIHKKSDLIQVSILINLLCLGSFTLKDFVGNDYKRDLSDPNYEILIENPIDDNLYNLSVLCLSVFFSDWDNYRTELLTAYNFLKVNHSFTPSQTQPSESLYLSNQIYEMAFSCGLSLEQNVGLLNGKDWEINLLRKCWFGISTDDFFPTFYNGCSITRLTETTTKLPKFSLNAMNHLNIEIEKITIEGIVLKNQFFEIYKKLNVMASNLKEKPNLNEFITTVSELETLFNKHIKPINFETQHPMKLEEKILKIYRFLIFLECSTMLSSCFIHLFFHYESNLNSDLSFYFFEKGFMRFTQIIDLGHKLINNNENIVRYFGAGFDYLIANKILFTLDSLKFFHTITIIRCRHVFYILNKAENKNIPHQLINSLNQFSNTTILAARMTVEVFQNLKSNYFLAWQSSKAGAFRLKMLSKINSQWLNPYSENIKLQQSVPPKECNIMNFWRPEQFDSLNSILLQIQPTDDFFKEQSYSESTESNDTINTDWDENGEADANWLYKCFDAEIDKMFFGNDQSLGFQPLSQPSNQPTLENLLNYDVIDSLDSDTLFDAIKSSIKGSLSTMLD